MNALEELRYVTENLTDKALEAEAELANVVYDPHEIYPLRDIAARIENEWIELPRDKDGDVIHIGDIMRDRDGNEIAVDKVCSGGFFVGTRNGCFLIADGFTHAKSDSWERIEADADTPEERDLVRRCRALADDDDD